MWENSTLDYNIQIKH